MANCFARSAAKVTFWNQKRSEHIKNKSQYILSIGWGGEYSQDIPNYKDSLLLEWYGMWTGKHLQASDKALCPSSGSRCPSRDLEE